MVSQTSARLIATAERREVTLKLRLSGATYQDIAKQIIGRFGKEQLPNGYDERYAYKDVKRELDRINAERDASTNALRAMEEERLDRMQAAVWGDAIKGHLGAVDRALRIMDRRAKLLGLDAPVKQELTGADGGPLRVIFEEAEDWRGGTPLSGAEDAPGTEDSL